MPTKNPRINVTLDTQAANLLVNLAKQEDMTVSSMAAALIKEGIERREDKVLSSLAESRDQKDSKRVKHDDVW